MSQALIHATCVAVPPDPAGPGRHAGAIDRPVGVLLRGASGAGKSDLALRLIDRGARLVADDQTELRLTNGLLTARAPGSIGGRMEVRGLGIAEMDPLSVVPVGLVVDLVPGQCVERLPEAETCEFLGVEVPLLRFDPFEASTPAKLRLALAGLAERLPADEGGLEAAREVSSGAAPGVPDEADAAPRRTVVLVTGMSGAGRSSALSILEDLGYESIDNLPLDHLDLLIDGGERPLALGVDIRTRGFAVRPVLEHLERLLEHPGLRVALLFLDCDDEVLARRYTETRRRHPLSHGRPAADGIAAERSLISPLRARADLVVDTSALVPAELRRILAGHLAPSSVGSMTICVTSFAYRNGLPRESDLVFDVRFLKNPHYEPDLRPLSGRDEAVAQFVAADPRFEPFFAQLTGLIAPLLPEFRREGKSYLTIAVGCTGGRHRSVATAERLARWLDEQGERVTLLHRDLAELPPGPPDVT